MHLQKLSILIFQIINIYYILHQAFLVSCQQFLSNSWVLNNQTSLHCPLHPIIPALNFHLILIVLNHLILIILIIYRSDSNRCLLFLHLNLQVIQ